MKMPQLTAELVRSINDREFLELLADHGPLTRGQIARAAQFSRPYALELTERLADRGLVAQHGLLESAQRGRKAALFGLPPDLGLSIGVDIAALDEIRVRRAVLGSPRRSDTSTPILPRVDLVEQIVDAVGLTERDRQFKHLSLVVGLPGSVDAASGDIIFAWGRPDWPAGTAKRLRHRLGCDIAFENEVNLRAVAEHHLGTAQDVDSFLLLSLGTGIGSALQLKGQILRGEHGAAGEIGYLPASTKPVPMRRQQGDIASYQEVAGAVALAAAAGTKHDPTYAWTATLLAKPATAPEWQAVAEQIAVGLLAMVTVVDPQCIILAGEVSKMLGGALIQPLTSVLTKHLPWEVDLRVSRLGDGAVLAGAIHEASRRLRDTAFGIADLQGTSLRGLG
ncbi:ROK family protein [Kribbella catacumbae]|uniref:ROK family protein n=1 Tax=Kribbella catacumbae TaxID=460086 RepID=UPI0003741518|nr:ROK family protein [Kribbella catacumbae]